MERLGRFSEALPFLERAVAVNPESREAQEQLVLLLVRLERWNAALAVAKAFVERMPEAEQANYLYGSLLSRMGRAAAALPYLRRAGELRARNAPDATHLR